MGGGGVGRARGCSDVGVGSKRFTGAERRMGWFALVTGLASSASPCAFSAARRASSSLDTRPAFFFGAQAGVAAAGSAALMLPTASTAAAPVGSDAGCSASAGGAEGCPGADASAATAAVGRGAGSSASDAVGSGCSGCGADGCPDADALDCCCRWCQHSTSPVLVVSLHCSPLALSPSHRALPDGVGCVDAPTASTAAAAVG